MTIIDLVIQKASETSQTEVARRTGVSQGTINKIIHGDVTNPSLATILKIARAYNLSVDPFCPEIKVHAQPKFDKSELEALAAILAPLLAKELRSL